MAPHWDHEIIAKLILQLYQQLEISCRTTLVAQADWVRDLSVTWCQSRLIRFVGLQLRVYSQCAHKTTGREVPQESPVPGQVSSFFRKMILRNQRLLNSLWFRFHWRCQWLRFCWTLWPLLQHYQAPGHWSFWRWRQQRLSNRGNPWWPRAGCCFNHLFRHRRWIFSSCCDPHPLLSFYNLSRCACEFWHWTAWSLRLCNHNPWRQWWSCRFNRTARCGPQGSSGTTQLGGWAGTQVEKPLQSLPPPTDPPPPQWLPTWRSPAS